MCGLSLCFGLNFLPAPVLVASTLTSCLWCAVALAIIFWSVKQCMPWAITSGPDFLRQCYAASRRWMRRHHHCQTVIKCLTVFMTALVGVSVATLLITESLHAGWSGHTLARLHQFPQADAQIWHTSDYVPASNSARFYLPTISSPEPPSAETMQALQHMFTARTLIDATPKQPVKLLNTPPQPVKETSAGSTDNISASTALLPYYSYSSNQEFTAAYLPVCSVSSTTVLQKPSLHFLTIRSITFWPLQPMQPEVYCASSSSISASSSNIPALLPHAESVPTRAIQNKTKISSTHKLVSLVMAPGLEFCLPLESLNQPNTTLHRNTSSNDLPAEISLLETITAAAAAQPSTTGELLDSLFGFLAATVICVSYCNWKG